jgi:hypothetical protein
MITLIDNISGAKETDSFTFSDAQNYCSTLFVSGLQGTETIPLQFTLDNGTTWTNVKCSGTSIELSISNNTLVLNVPGRYRLNKSVTAGPVIAKLARSQEV